MQSSTPEQNETLPDGVNWLYLFQSFNAVNFTIAMGAPMVLLIRFLGGSELHVGIVAAIPPLLVMLQLVSTRLVERLGYRGSMMLGWGLRSLLLLFIAPLPLLKEQFSPSVLLGVLIAAHLGFNIIRGLTSGAWFPWLTQLIPDSVRGRFVGMEQRIINISAFITLIISGMILQGDNPAPWKYSILILFATFVGVSSAYFLGRGPDRPVPHVKRNRGSNGLRHVIDVAKECLREVSYRRTIGYLVLYNLLVLPTQGFLIIYIKENLGYTTGGSLKFQALITLGVLLSSVVWGGLADRWGSKPILKLTISGILVQYAFWGAFATGAIEPNLVFVTLLQFMWGVMLAGHVVAAVKIMLGCCPRRDLTAEMAVIQVSTAICTGVAPLIMGTFLKMMRPNEIGAISVISPGFALIFGTSMLGCACALLMIARLQEPAAKSSRQLFVYLILDWPTRILSQGKRM